MSQRKLGLRVVGVVVVSVGLFALFNADQSARNSAARSNDM
jgi:hypothetical protein